MGEEDARPPSLEEEVGGRGSLLFVLEEGRGRGPGSLFLSIGEEGRRQCSLLLNREQERRVQGHRLPSVEKAGRGQGYFLLSLEKRKAEGKAFSSSTEEEGFVEENGRGQSSPLFSLDMEGRVQGQGSLLPSGKGEPRARLSPLARHDNGKGHPSPLCKGKDLFSPLEMESRRQGSLLSLEMAMAEGGALVPSRLRRKKEKLSLLCPLEEEGRRPSSLLVLLLSRAGRKMEQFSLPSSSRERTNE